MTNDMHLATRRGKLTLALLAAIAFLDFVDASIVNVALPSIRRDLDFSQQSLQWIPSGYLLTYGGFMLLGGRAADLLGRRRVLVAGGVGVGGVSVIRGVAQSAGGLAGALVLLALFVINELRVKNPLAPLSIFRINGLGYADATQLVAFAGFLALFFFLTLYMQNVLGYSPIQTGAAYLPLTFAVGVAAGISSQLMART